MSGFGIGGSAYPKCGLDFVISPGVAMEKVKFSHGKQGLNLPVK